MDMFCQNCGTENPAENRYCVNCAAPLPPKTAVASPLEIPVYQSQASFEMTAGGEDILGLDSGRSAFTSSDGEADSGLWPPESVFVAVPDTEIEPEAAYNTVRPETVFEDDQADDVFELSLSGVRIEDLADPIDNGRPDSVASFEIVEAYEPVPMPDSILSEEPSFVASWLEQVAAVVFPVSSGAINPSLEVLEPVAVKDEDHSRRGGMIRAAGMIVAALILFGAGVGTGRWLSGIPVNYTPEPAVARAVKQEIQEPSLPHGMAYVPGGEFRMGSDEGDPYSSPAHNVTVGPFYMDLTEVTNEAYLKFVTATGHDQPAGWENALYMEGQADFPVTGVTWYEAAEYAAWMGKRLPTETEWEFAARGFDGRTYPWGNVWDAKFANIDNISAGIRSVGSGEKSPFGLFDMSGNVWEWTASDARPYPGGKEFPWSRLRLKIIRGGNWQSSSKAATTVFRGYYGAEGERNYGSTGFRCVKEYAKQ